MISREIIQTLLPRTISIIPLDDGTFLVGTRSFDMKTWRGTTFFNYTKAIQFVSKEAKRTGYQIDNRVVNKVKEGRQRIMKIKLSELKRIIEEEVVNEQYEPD
jgi:hypothetical protein